MSDRKRKNTYLRKWRAARKTLREQDVSNSVFLDSSEEESDVNVSHSSSRDIERPNDASEPSMPASNSPNLTHDDDQNTSDSDTEENNWDLINVMNDMNYQTDESESDEDDQTSVKDDLAEWASQDGIKHNHVDNLLKILRKKVKVLEHLPATAG